MSNSTDAPLSAAELAEIRARYHRASHTPSPCQCDIHRLLATLDSLTARSSEITDEAVEAACQAYRPHRIGTMAERGGELFVWSHSTAMRAALQAAEATRGEP